MNFNYIAKLAVLFILFYAVLFVLSNILNLGLIKWGNNPMYLLMPFIGFFFVFISVDYIDKYLEIKFANTIFFPLAFIIACFVSYWIVVYWYLGNVAQLNNSQVAFDFWEKLRNNAFLIFVFSGLFGWVSKFIMDRISR